MSHPQPELHTVRSESGLTPSQVPIWIGQTLHPSSPLYNMAFAFVLAGAIDPEVFRAAWETIVEASDSLRTSIAATAALGGRRVVRERGPETALIDFDGRPDPEQHFRQWAQERSSRPLPLDGQLVDSVLVRLGPARWGWYLNQHHLVTDASSTVLLVRELAGEYARRAGRGGNRAGAQALPAYYPTAAALSHFPDPAARANAAEHWKQRLGVNRVVHFYGRTRRPESTRSTRRTLVLDGETSERLRTIAEEPGFLSLTPDISRFALFATLLTAWLRRVSGQSAVGFDAPAHNRPTAAARRCLGLFIEMFPFPVDVLGTDTFRTLGGRSLAEAQSFLRHAFPGTGPASGASASNVVLNYFAGAFGSFAGVPVTSEWLHPGDSDSVHALRLQVHDYDATGCYTIQFDFNDEIFDDALRTRAIGHFQRLIAALLDNRDRPIDSIDLLSDDERDELVARFDRTGDAPMPSTPVTTAIAAQAQQRPARVAVRDGAREISYHELLRQVRAAAAALVRRGVRPGDAVAIMLPRSAEAVVAVLAALEARACYVPIDPANPRERVDHILTSCAPRLVVGLDAGPDEATAGPARVAIGALLEDSGEPASLPEPLLSDVAYVIYTSGSTGIPKGVPIEHKGLAAYMEWAVRQYVHGETLTVPLFTSLAFDLTVTSLYLPLMTGGTLDIYREPDGPADTAIGQVIAENRADFIKLTPSHLALLRHFDLSRSRIRRMVVGGEDLKAHVAAAVAGRFPHPVEIYNEYGPTEAVVGCMVHRYDASTDTEVSVPIGRPADHVRLYVLNDAGSLVPAGVPGELHVARVGLARGYRGSDERETPFVADSIRGNGVMYRTGDLVRVNDAGTLTYLGRKDRQLKLAGIRVEPGEIEAALLSHPAIRACHVAMRAASGPAPAPAPRSASVHCTRCGLPSSYPGTTFDAQGVCATCRGFDDYESQVRQYFRNIAELEPAIRRGQHGSREFDCMMLLSGGKDSTYALCRLVDMGLRVYAFSFDNGYISQQAKDNIRRVVAALGVRHEFATTPATPAIFRDSLVRFSNVCNGCFKTIYTLSLTRAHDLHIPAIVTGLSRGQMFETRLTPELFRGRRTAEEVDAAILAARKAYHRSADEVSRSLDVSLLQQDDIFDEVAIIDFYRYCDVALHDMLAYLERRVPWMRPSDTGRSTNCLANDAGIFVHIKERGYHNYALPYSWDVRLGHKTRADAIHELNDQLDIGRVRGILADIGYDDRGYDSATRPALAAWIVADRDVADEELRLHLASRLPASLVPTYLTRVPRIPLSASGKVDDAALPSAGDQPIREAFVAPQGIVEERIAVVWAEVLGVARVGARTSFFELGGTSLGAMETVLRICTEFGVNLPLQAIFTSPTIARLAIVVEALVVEQIAALSDDDVERLAADPDYRP